MRGSIVWTIFWKELRDTLRDRRTLVVMILLPVVLYPVLILVLGQVTVSQQARLKERLVKVALVGEAHPELRSRLKKGKSLVGRKLGHTAKTAILPIKLILKVCLEFVC